MKDIGEVGDKQRAQKDIAFRAGNEEEHAQHAQNIDGQNAKRALPVKVPVISAAAAGANQQGGDEEPGEYKEDVDAGRSIAEDVVQKDDERVPALGLN